MRGCFPISTATGFGLAQIGLAQISLAFACGQVFEATGSYDWVWYVDIVLAIGAALIHLPIPEAPLNRAALA